MILKRVLPVIAAIAVLCCMMIVPASAASYGDSSGRVRPYMDLDLRIILSDQSELCVALPSALHTSSEQTWNCSGDVFYQLASDTYGDSSTFMLSVDASNVVDCVYFTAAPFVVPYNEKVFESLLSFPSLSNAGLSVRFDLVYLDQYDDPVRVPFEHIYYASGLSAPFLTAFNQLFSYNIPANTYVLIDSLSICLDRGQVSNFHFSIGLVLRSDENLSPVDFFGRIDYGDVIVETVDGVGLLQGFADFCVNGIASFLDVDFIGDFSLGDFLTPAVAILFVLVVLKMLS